MKANEHCSSVNMCRGIQPVLRGREVNIFMHCFSENMDINYLFKIEYQSICWVGGNPFVSLETNYYYL